jgi:hypothetical protein
MRELSLLMLVTASLAGCQCLVPVDEDGGVIPSVDAGGPAVDAGGPECNRAVDCPGAAPACDVEPLRACACGLVRRCQAGRCATVENVCPVPFDGGAECTVPSDCAGSAMPAISYCGTATGAWSCAFGRCVVECAPGRTCRSADAGCLTCDGMTSCGAEPNCQLLTHLSIEASTCPQFTATDWLRTERLPEPACTATLRSGDGGVAGTITFTSTDELFADLPDVGGGCVGRSLPTGAIRYSLSCPGCMMSVRPEIVGP